MGAANPPNEYCPAGDYYTEEFMWPIWTCPFMCNWGGGICDYIPSFSKSCLEGSGSCYYEPFFATCAYYSGVLYCFCFYRLASWTCTKKSDAASNLYDIPRTVQHDYFGLFFDNMLYDLYNIENEFNKVISFRSRLDSVNIRIKFNPTGFLS